MNNSYTIENEVVTIKAFCKGEAFRITIDKISLAKIDIPNITWYVHHHKASNLFYAECMLWENGKRKNIAMHRVVTDASDEYLVDHINNNGLDNKVSNLRLANKSENAQNINKLYSCNTSGFHGVSWHKHLKKWRARVQLKGILVLEEYFHSQEDAALAVSRARNKFMPFSKEGTVTEEYLEAA